jgi:hypothetical protein
LRGPVSFWDGEIRYIEGMMTSKDWEELSMIAHIAARNTPTYIHHASGRAEPLARDLWDNFIRLLDERAAMAARSEEEKKEPTP